MRNLEGKVPAERWREVKAQALAAYTAASPMLARLAKEEFVKRFERELPSATACFLDDFEACIAHLRLPIAHRKAIRTTNLLERLFGEERQRTKIIPHAFGERAVLKLMYAALLRASRTWRRIVISEFELKQIEELRSELEREFKERTGSVVQSASHQRIYSKRGLDVSLPSQWRFHSAGVQEARDRTRVPTLSTAMDRRRHSELHQLGSVISIGCKRAISEGLG